MTLKLYHAIDKVRLRTLLRGRKDGDRDAREREERLKSENWTWNSEHRIKNMVPRKHLTYFPEILPKFSVREEVSLGDASEASLGDTSEATLGDTSSSTSGSI